MSSKNNGTKIPAAAIKKYEEFLLELEKLGLHIQVVSVVVRGTHLTYQEEQGAPVPYIHHARRTRKIKSSLTVYPLKERKQKNKEQ